MFRNLITIPVRINMYNKRVFSSYCNNRFKVDEVTNSLIRQERYLEIINKKIDILTVMSFFNIMFSMIF
jgi:hypothetical protein